MGRVWQQSESQQLSAEPLHATTQCMHSMYALEFLIVGLGSVLGVHSSMGLCSGEGKDKTRHRQPCSTCPILPAALGVGWHRRRAAVDNKPLLTCMHPSATCWLQEDVARQTTLRNFPNYTTYALDYRCVSYHSGKSGGAS